MELIVEVVIVGLQLLAELLVQIFAEVGIEVALRSISEPMRSEQERNPYLAALGYTILGALVGGLSVFLLPESFLKARWMRIVYLIVGPVVAGLMMNLLGAWRRKRGQELIRIDRFAFGYLFALSAAVCRTVFVK